LKDLEREIFSTYGKNWKILGELGKNEECKGSGMHENSKFNHKKNRSFVGIRFLNACTNLSVTVESSRTQLLSPTLSPLPAPLLSSSCI